jgi:hypothetical protein
VQPTPELLIMAKQVWMSDLIGIIPSITKWNWYMKENRKALSGGDEFS